MGEVADRVETEGREAEVRRGDAARLADDARRAGDPRRRGRLSYCVVLPAFNEGPRLGEVVAAVPAWVDEIVVVDDGSTDDTLAVAQALAADEARVTVIHHPHNEGVGGAMATGYRAALAAGHDVVVKADGDGQMDFSELRTLVRPLELGMAEYAKGNRFRRTGRPKGMPRMRWFGSVLLSFLTKVASGYWHVFDPQCGFTAITGPTLRRLKLEGIAKDYFFENDMLIRLNVIDARVVDVATSTRYGAERSTLRIGHVSWTFPARLLRGFAWRFVKRHVVNDFGLVALLTFAGGVLAVFGFVFGLWRWAESAASGTPATAGTVMIAVVPLILGVQMLLQALTLEVQGSAGAAETREYARRADEAPVGRDRADEPAYDADHADDGPLGFD
jgi:dolichol-phosphate mannosyltransferase